MATHRTVLESKLYGHAKTTLPVECQRLDEILEGIIWVLCRKPDFFPRIPGTSLHRARTEAFQDLPVFVIWFRFDAENVYLELIEHATPED